MKNFEKLKMTLFDSTNANFKLEVEAQFTRGNRETGFRDIVYTTDRYTGILNPNIYLTFTYRSDEVSPVYTSYPQLFRIREAFETVKNYVADGSGFVTVDGVLAVRGDLNDPVVVANIGKNNNWISLKLVTAESDEDGVLKVSPCVAIELSSSNRLTSILSVDEFLTVYTIIRDLNLSTIQCMMSLGFLNIDSRNGNYGGGYSQQVPMQQVPMNNGWNAAPQNNYGQQPPMNGNWSGGGTTPGGYGNPPARPRYNNQSYRNTSSARQVPPPPTGNSGRVPTGQAAAPTENGWPNDGNPYPNYQAQSAAAGNNNLPPRNGGGSIMNMKAVDETPVAEIDYNDTAAIDAIFDN